MAWMQKLYQTYENNAHMIGEVEDNATLRPISHITLKMQVEITINADGKFETAKIIDKDDVKTLVPATESAASRAGSVIAPFPLSDTLSYIAMDYAEHVKTEKEKKKAEERFLAYSSGLRSWAESDYSHPKVKAIYHYVMQGTMIQDLVREKLIKLDDNNKFSNDKIGGSAYEKVFVRFVVAARVGETTQTWRDKTLWNSFIQYYQHMQKSNTDLCYVKAEPDTICNLHPKGIVAACYGAKLISANDTSGFTFRGRFATDKEAYAVSYDASQKAHAALTWLAANQSKVLGTTDKRTLICWSPQGQTPPSLDPFEDEDDNKGNKEAVALTKPEFIEKLDKFIKGYADEFKVDDDILTMTLEAATTGRLSITYYKEMLAHSFLERIHYWRSSCLWDFPHFDAEKKLSYAVKNPSTYKIVDYVFGVQNEKGFMVIGDKLKKEQTQRILHCILDKHAFPYDMVRAIYNKATNPQGYSFLNYEIILATACALTYKYYFDKDNNNKKEVRFDMSLNLEEKDRSYIFGRLLAIADRAEKVAMQAKYKKTGEGTSRETNAMRYMSAFQHHPMHVYRTIRTNLVPYLESLDPGLREYYKTLMDEVFEMISTEDIKELNKPLNEIFLLGYSHQRTEMRNKAKEKEAKNKNSEGTSDE